MAQASTEGPVAETATGKVRGFANGPISVFKGIPYGATTAGAHRFAPARRPQPWTDVRDATRLGARAPQLPAEGIIPEEVIAFANEPMSEECLFLNVWTPALRDGRKRPVMVWLHGGGYFAGSGGQDRYDGTRLAMNHDVVVVTLNHRLNVFGHLYLGEIADERYTDSGNVGILDIVAALEWVRDNIAEFGGDARNVTIFGESGGGGKVITLMAMPAAAGLFHRAIAQSGLALRQATRENATKEATALLKQLGLAPKDWKRLFEISDEQLLNAIRDMRSSPRFTPVVDGRSLPRHPFDPDAPDISRHVPLIVGSNATEVTFFGDTPLDPIDEATLRRHVKRLLCVEDAEANVLIALYRKSRPTVSNEHLYQLIASDYWMSADIVTLAERKSAAGAAPVYVYRFEKETPVREGKLHSVHGLEIPYVFDNLDAPTAPALTGTEADRYPLARAMSHAWTTFARTGTPNDEGLAHWPAYTAEQRNVMIFDTTTRLAIDPYREERLAIAEIRKRQLS
ncbi:MAG: carboxylesterase/lipase family protein [Steroidobacteraceae bacterium]|nr:carboxylesterase/lipase family protein [Steroidobacteraceae bacterium]